MQTRTDELVNEVFALTKQNLSPDDPLLTVMLLQEKGLQRVLEQQSARRIEQDQAFFAQLDERQTKITEMYSELIQYRERVVAELLTKNQQVAIQIENRVERKVLGSMNRLRRLIVVCLTLAAIFLVGIGSVFFN